MTRQTIDVGIDLGTTNSCIAVMGPDGPQVVRNNDNGEFTPSAVAIRKSGDLYVGRRAKQQVESDPENAQAEFKRYMGVSDWRKTFAASGRIHSAAELSAEVLKALRGDVDRRLRELPTAAVITIPAAFEQNQSADTTEAARLAGFEPSMLLQEPIAAAFAYAQRRPTDRALWLVYDLGGGTFDAALVRLEDGQTTVVDHAGDNHLGGTRIDWDIVDRLLMPAAAREFGLDGFRRSAGMNPRWRGNIAKLKGVAEELKIQLSTTDSATVDVELRGLDGESYDFEAVVTRAQLDEIALPYYQRSVELCRRTLAGAGVGPSAVEQLLLVGGSTLAPAVRELLADPVQGLGIPIDASLDPITVVATGASLYAAGQLIARQAAPVVPRQGEVGLTLRYNPRSDDPEPLIGGQATAAGRTDWTGFTIRFSDPSPARPWVGPAVPLRPDGQFVAEVFPQLDSTTAFAIELLDPTGAAVPVTPSTATYQHVRNVVDNAVPTLRRSVGVGLIGDRMKWFAPRGAVIDPPYVATHTVFTTEGIDRSSSRGEVRLPILEGERDRADRNSRVGMIRIQPHDVHRDVPAGTKIELTVEIHQTRGITATAYVPFLDRDWEATMNLPGLPDVAELQDRRAAAQARYATLRERAEASADPEARRRLDTIVGSGAVDELDRLGPTATVAEADAITLGDRLQEFESGLDEVEDALEIPELRAKIDERRGWLVSALDQTGDVRGRAALEQLDMDIERAIRDGDVPALRRLLEAMAILDIDVLARNDLWAPIRFRWLSDNVGRMSDPRRAVQLVAQGEHALATGNQAVLRNVNIDLANLLPAEDLPQMPGDGGPGNTDGGPQ